MEYPHKFWHCFHVLGHFVGVLEKILVSGVIQDTSESKNQDTTMRTGMG